MKQVEILRWALANGCPWKRIDDNARLCVEVLELAYEYHVKYNPVAMRYLDDECMAFLESYGKAWEDGDFELAIYFGK